MNINPIKMGDEINKIRIECIEQGRQEREEEIIKIIYKQVNANKHWITEDVAEDLNQKIKGVK